MSIRITVREICCLESGVFEVVLVYGSNTLEGRLQVRDPWIINHTTQDSGLQWLFKDYPTKHPFDQAKAQVVAVNLRDYGQQLVQAIHLTKSFEQNDSLANAELVLVDIEGSVEFQKLHWETMESAFKIPREARWPPILVRRTVTNELNSHDPVSSPYAAIQKRPFNILLVVARQPNSDDIDPLLTAEILTKLCASTSARLGDQGTKPNLEIVRPGTWNAFEHLIDLRTHQWHAKRGSGPWYDIVHFDLHGTIQNSEAYIHFLSGSGSHVFKQNAVNVGRVLARNHVTTVFLNACESGHLTEDPRACFAKGLINSGVSNVLAMSYSLTNTSASILVGKFYEHLLTVKLDFWAASQAARQALRDDPFRDCRFGRKVELQDSIIPIVFLSRPAADKSWVHDYARQLPLDLKHMQDHERTSVILVNGVSTKFGTTPIIGRESDVLKIEWMAADKTPIQRTTSMKGKAILLKGAAGVGKSEFALYLASWWIQTNFVETAVYLDVSHSTFQSLLKIALIREDGRPSDSSVSSKHRTLYVLDHMNSKTLPTSRTPFGPEDKSRFRTAVAALAGTDNIVLLISRKDEEWLRVPVAQRHQLQNLAPYSATILASGLYDEMKLRSVLDTKNEADALEVLLCRLDYNPLAIRVLLYALMERSTSIDDCKPSRLLQQFLQLPDYVPLSGDSHQQIQECRDFVSELIEQQPQKAEIILSRLALCSGWFDEDWYRLTYLSGGQDIGLNDATITAFVKKYLLTSGWVTKKSQSCQLYKNSQATEEWVVVDGYHMHALLINTVREAFFLISTRSMTRSVFTKGSWWHFTELMLRKAGSYYERDPSTLEGLRCQILTEAEAFSFLTAFEVCLQDALFQDPLDPVVIGANKRMWGAHGLWGILRHLHRCSKKINSETRTAPQTVALSLTMILTRMERVQNYLFLRLALGQLDPKVETRITNVEYCLRVSRMMAEHYYLRNPMRSGQHIALCLAFVCRNASRTITFNWESQDIFVWLLLTLSYCYIHTQSDLRQAERILRVTLQACRFVEQRTVTEFSDTVPAFDLARLTRQDLQNSPHKQTLIARMFMVATFRLCAFKALRMIYRAFSEAESADYFEALEMHTQCFFFYNLPASMLNKLPHLGEKYGDVDVRDLPFIVIDLQSSHAMLRSSMEPDGLLKTGQFDKAKETSLHNLQESLVYGNPYNEYIFLSKAVDMEFEAGNWAATEVPIRRILEMRREIKSGPWLRTHPTQIKFDHALYGAAMVKAGDLNKALWCFLASEYSLYEDYASMILQRILVSRTMNEFINIALYVGRSSLISMVLLPRTNQSVRRPPLEASKFKDFDAAFCRLLLRKASSKWHISGTMEQQELGEALMPNFVITSETVSNDQDSLTQINDKFRLANLLGRRESDGLELLNTHVESVTANCPNLPQNMDLSALESYLPNEQDCLDSMPDYFEMAKSRIASSVA